MNKFIRWNLAEERNKDKEQFSFAELVLFFLESTQERTLKVQQLRKFWPLEIVKF